MEEKKIVKKLATATLVSGAMLLAVNKPSTVHAADVDVKNNTNEAQSQKQPEQVVTKDQAQKDVTKAQSERDNAKSQADEAQKNADKANQDVNSTQKQVEEATKANNSAKELQKEATPEHINEVKANIVQPEQEVANKAKAQEVAQKEANKQSMNLAYAQKDVDTANYWVNEYSNKLAQNQKAIDDAKANLNATQDQVNQAQQEVNNDQNKVAEAQKAVQNANAQKDQLAEQVNNANNAVSEATNEVNDKQSSLSQARQQADSAKAELDAAQSTVNGLQAKVDSINVITMPKNYFLYNKYGMPDRVNTAVVDEAYNANSYKDDQEAKKEAVAHNKDGVTQLTDAQQKELTLWVAGILNDVRQQVGLKPNLVVTPDSLAHTNYIATHSTVPTFDHDTNAIDAADKLIPDLSMSSESIGTPWYAENMNDVKRGVYYHMLSMIFGDADANWGHAFQLTGDETSMLANTPGNPNSEYFGVSFRKDKGFIQFDSYTKWSVDPKEQKFEIPNYDSLKASLENAKHELAVKQTSYGAATNTVNNAEKAYTEVATKLAQAQQAQLAAKNAYDVANANVTKLNNDLANLQSSLKSAQEKLDKLTESKSDKDFDLWKANGFYEATKKDLDGAKSDAANVQKDFDEVKATYDQAMAKLNQTKADTQQAQDKLNSLKSNLSDLQNADENATKAAQALTDATTKLAQAKKSADDLTTKLVEVKATLAEKETALTTAKSVLAKIEKEDAAKEAVKKAQEEATKAAEEKAEHTNFYKAGNDKLLDSKGQVMPSDYTVKENKVYDAKGEFVGVVSSKVESRVVAHAIAKVESKENTTSNSNVQSAIASSSNAFSTYAPKHAEAHTVKAGSVLPTTGSHDTNLTGVIGLALASVGSLLGLTSSKKKNLR